MYENRHEIAIGQHKKKRFEYFCPQPFHALNQYTFLRSWMIIFVIYYYTYHIKNDFLVLISIFRIQFEIISNSSFNYNNYKRPLTIHEDS